MLVFYADAADLDDKEAGDDEDEGDRGDEE
jgi:hypothetical protein